MALTRNRLVLALAAQVVVWFSVLLFWIVVSRNNHPTLLINVIATSCLVSVSASAVYVCKLVLEPRYARTHNKSRLLLEVLLVVAVLDIVCVLVIQFAYDILWGPDPARFGFWTNVALEALFIVVHLVVAYGLTAVWRRVVRS